jgi:hypothetical protein
MIRRMGILRLAAVALAFGASVPAAKAGEDLPANLHCTFTAGTSGTFEAGSFASKSPTPLSFDIGSIDLEAQSATLNAGADGKGGKLNVVRAINANHFLEAVNEGFLNLTTVYEKDATTGKFPAVHSRHFGLLGQPVFGQYTGFCSPK